MITLTKLAESVTPLKESILGKTADKVSGVKNWSTAIDKELKNIPTIDDFKYREFSDNYVVYWECPKLLQYMKDLCDMDDRAIRDDFVGIGFSADQQDNLIFPFFYDKKKRHISMNGWYCKWMAVGTLESREKNVIAFIKYSMTDIDKMTEIMTHYNQSFIRKTNERRDLTDLM